MSGNSRRVGYLVRMRGVAITMLQVALVLLVGAVGRVQAQTEVVEYYATDAIGSIRVVFDANGTVKAQSDYLPFGEAWQPSGNLPTQRFTGQQRDIEEEQDYFGARSYVPRSGRFSTTDPVFAGLFQPQAWNRYAYALNNPLTYTDPTGLQAAACTQSGYFTISDDGEWTYHVENNKGCTDNGGGGGAAYTITSLWFSVRDFFFPTAGGIESDYYFGGGRRSGPEAQLLKDPGGEPDGNITETGNAIVDVFEKASLIGAGKKQVASTVARNIAREAAKRATRNAFSRSGRAPEYHGGYTSQDGFLRAADKYLGAGYREASPGRYVSADGLRQLRFGSHETRGASLHGHFEAYDRPGGHVIENTRVDIVLKPRP